MKLPCRSVRASLTVFTPSRMRDTTAPTSGFPRVSRTVPEMVASDLLELAASALLGIKEPSSVRDKQRPNPLLMRKTSATKVPLEAVDRRTGSDEETYRNPLNSPLLSVT